MKYTVASVCLLTLLGFVVGSRADTVLPVERIPRGRALTEAELKQLEDYPPAPAKPATQPATQSASATQVSTRPAAMDATSQALVNKLKSEVVGLRKDQAEYEKQLRAAPAKVRQVDHGMEMGPGESIWHSSSIAYNIPNPQIPTLKEQIQKTKDAIAVREKQIADLINPQRKKAVSEVSQADAERAEILADMQKLWGDSKSVANERVAYLLESKVITHASDPVSEEAVDWRKEALYKATLLNMSVAAKDRDAVLRAAPEMSFKLVNYDFTFLTQTGLVRVHQGYVLLCKIDQVWWPLAVNVDGISAAWESYEHPLVTPKVWQEVRTLVRDYRNKQKEANRAANIPVTQP